jgi:hypothetical protein
VVEHGGDDGHPFKVRGKRLDQLCDDNVYVEWRKNGFLIVDAATRPTSAF